MYHTSKYPKHAGRCYHYIIYIFIYIYIFTFSKCFESSWLLHFFWPFWEVQDESTKARGRSHSHQLINSPGLSPFYPKKRQRCRNKYLTYPHFERIIQYYTMCIIVYLCVPIQMGVHPIFELSLHIPYHWRLPDCQTARVVFFRAQRLRGSCKEWTAGHFAWTHEKNTTWIWLQWRFMKKNMEKHHDQPANLGGYAIFRPAWKLSLQFAPQDGNVSISRWKLLSFQLVCSKIWPTHPPAVQRLPNHLGSVAPQNRTGLSNKW